MSAATQDAAVAIDTEPGDSSVDTAAPSDLAPHITSSAGSFDAKAVESFYDCLDVVPDSLYKAVITFPTTDLDGLVAGVMHWREKLLEGVLPDPETVTWPEEPLLGAAFGIIGRQQLDAYAKGQEKIADEIVLMLLRLAADSNRALEDLKSALREMFPDDGEEALEAKAKPRYAQVVRDAVLGQWIQRLRTWEPLADLLGDPSLVHACGYDLSRTLPQETGFKEAVCIAGLLQRSPRAQGLRNLIRRLGRLQDGTDAASVPEMAFEAQLQTKQEKREIRTPWSPHRIEGLERSDNIGWMLPSEAVLLKHPKLKMLWHARRADRALLTYRAEGTEYEEVSVAKAVQVPVARPKPVDRGPLIICVDTSGSMQGLPEHIAKAVALETARTAFKEKRKCLLYSFSGPGDVKEHELSFDSAHGMSRLLAFIGQSFGGGTDLREPLRRVSRRLQEPTWKRADVVIVTDGDFYVDPDVDVEYRKARDACGARMWGVLVGPPRCDSLAALCEEVHPFDKWL